MNFLLDATPRFLDGVVPKVVATPISAVIRRGVIATMPVWMRELSGLSQSRATDVAVTAQIKTVVAAIARDKRLQVTILARFSPLTVPIAAPVLFDIPGREPADLDPRRGVRAPRDAEPARAIRRDLGQALRGHGPKPYDLHHHDPVVAFPAAGSA